MPFAPDISVGGALGPGALVALALVLLAGAALPSLSSMTVVARSATLGRRHGIAVAVGITSGDLLFIVIAILGAAWLIDRVPQIQFWLRLIGIVWLSWLGLQLLRRSTMAIMPDRPDHSDALISSYLSGLMITLVDYKAIAFYLGLLPALMDLNRLTLLGAGGILLVAAVCVSIPKIVYALVTERFARRLVDNPRVRRMTRFIIGLMLLSIALCLAVGL